MDYVFSLGDVPLRQVQSADLFRISESYMHILKIL